MTNWWQTQQSKSGTITQLLGSVKCCQTTPGTEKLHPTSSLCKVTTASTTCAKRHLPSRYSNGKVAPSALCRTKGELCVLICPDKLKLPKSQRVQGKETSCRFTEAWPLQLGRLIVKVEAHLKRPKSLLCAKLRPSLTAEGWHHPASCAAGSCQSSAQRAGIAPQAGGAFHRLVGLPRAQITEEQQCY